MQQHPAYPHAQPGQPQGAAPQFHACAGAGYPAPPQAPWAGYSIQPSNVGMDPGSGLSTWVDFSNGCYLKGFAVGAVTTLVLTHPSVQKALIRGAVKLWSFVQGGVEEVKEQFQDIKAEMSQET